MAQQSQHLFYYQKFTILKDQPLGHGSYGAVYKAKCDQLMCAAKVLHPTIVDTYDPGSKRILQRFQQECDFLYHIRHPHIVQYLGVCSDPDSNLPVLLMELLDESLTKMLERSKNPISYHIQVDICHDVSLAVAYLHSNGIIHRDLSGNNVLVTAGSRAKVTDFGMSKLVGPASDCHLTPLTFCPGTLGYMSPESLKEPPKYTEKLDVFSEGVIMIQVCTRQFPDPGPATKEIQHSMSPTGTIQVPVLEPERRKNHIDLIDPSHPLLSIAIDCLEYREDDRPSSEELCQRLALLKEGQRYVDSNAEGTTPVAAQISGQDELAVRIAAKDREINACSRQITEKDKEISSLRQLIATKDRQIAKITAYTQKLTMKMKQELDQMLESKQTIEDASTLLLRHVTDFQKHVEDLQRELSQMAPKKPKEIEFKWKEGGKAPFCDWRGPESSAVDDNVAYFSSNGYLYSYDASTEKWRTLPTCPQRWGSLAVIQNLLTMIGGVDKSNSKQTKKLVSLTVKRKWVEQFPPMPTSRTQTTATAYKHHLIVAGGSSTGYSKDNTDAVEILNTDTLVWCTATSLPHPFAYASATVCGDRLYILGGNNKKGKCRSVFSCSLLDLLQSCQSNSMCDESRPSQVWRHDTDVPVYWTTCASVYEQLVAVGGYSEDGKETTAVYVYDKDTHSWMVISHLTTARYYAFVAVLKSSQLLVVSGNESLFKRTESVEIANF